MEKENIRGMEIKNQKKHFKALKNFHTSDKSEADGDKCNLKVNFIKYPKKRVDKRQIVPVRYYLVIKVVFIF
ncbi:hypothetical protein ACFOTA_11710 [Chitinophaga sp. GCM10012297]|uniref:Uncharacterized protein n=1 Tax=Chitinophaga chungangae TaxID=2821488 RepID=A0ABS3YDV8_9BACT|nr:hypothetical protein [Chitinophaga chungangae]MBO9152877.1 hypothetical protein [Chitinophaga chungangae]